MIEQWQLIRLAEIQPSSSHNDVKTIYIWQLGDWIFQIWQQNRILDIHIDPLSYSIVTLIIIVLQ